MKEKANNNQSDNLQDLLKKRALGYDLVESVEEYSANDDGEIVLTKKKVSIKPVPPDISALKLLLDAEEKNISSMTDEELEQEKRRLILLLKEED